MLTEHKSESGCPFDLEILNDGSLEDLYSKLDFFLQDKIGPKDLVNHSFGHSQEAKNIGIKKIAYL